MPQVSRGVARCCAARRVPQCPPRRHTPLTLRRSDGAAAAAPPPPRPRWAPCCSAGAGAGALRATRPAGFAFNLYPATAGTFEAGRVQSVAEDAATAVGLRGWDPEAAARHVFDRNDPTSNVNLDAEQSRGIVWTQVAMLQCVVVAVCNSMYLYDPAIYNDQMAMSLCTSMCIFCAWCLTKFYQRIVRCAVHLRIEPDEDGTPAGAAIVCWCISGVWSVGVALKTFSIPIESIALIGVSADGRWRTIAFRRFGRADHVCLSPCQDAAKAIPFVVAMRRHLETLDPELRRMRIMVVVPADPTHLVWNVTDQEIPDPSPDAPWPRVSEHCDTAAGQDGRWYKGGNLRREAPRGAPDAADAPAA